MEPNTVVEVESLEHRYGQRQALAGVSFSVRRGEIFGLLGPNGGGKTTLFRLLSTLMIPSGGTARVFGCDVTERAAAIRARLGVVFQAPSLDVKLTAAENLWHQGHLYGLSGKALGQRVQELLRQVGLAERARDRVETFSGGMQRRLEVAKGLLHRPALLLLDEPSTGLDPGARRDLWTYLRRWRDTQDVTILVTTHFMEEAEHCDRLAILDRGNLVALGSPAELKNEIGGDVISLRTAEPKELRGRIRERFDVEPTLLNGTLRIEHTQGHELVGQLMEFFGSEIESVTLGKPSLDDVFIRRTGHRFWDEAVEGSELMAAVNSGLWLPVYTLWWREIVRFYRQRSRVIGALATPIFFWVLIGSGIGTSVPASGVASDGENYLHYFFPGTLVLIVLFTAIFSTISIIEDRREGFLQAVLVAPVFRSSIVLGKVLGGTTLAMMQGVLFLLVGLALGMVPLGVVATLSAVGVLFVVAFALTSLGFAIAWSMDSTQGYHSIMNLFLIPMWLLSGALFPVSGAFTWIKAVMTVNPLSYGVAAVRQSLHPGTTLGSELAPLYVCLIVSVLFAAVMFAVATGTAVRRGGRSLA